MKAIGLFAIVSLAVASAAAPAQDAPLGSRLGKRKDIVTPQSPPQATQSAHRLAGCIYIKQPTQARAALDSLDANDATKRLEALDARGTCINLNMISENGGAQRASMPAPIYRGMLAEAALRQGDIAGLLPPLERQPTYSRAWFAVTGRPLAVDEMAACMADTNPLGLRALFATTAETPEELAAFSNLSSWMGPCLTAGAKLSANRQSLRAAFAEALYHRAVTPTAPVAAPLK